MCSSSKNDEGKGAWDLYRIGEEELRFFLRAESQSVKNQCFFETKSPLILGVYFVGRPPRRFDFFKKNLDVPRLPVWQF